MPRIVVSMSCDHAMGIARMTGGCSMRRRREGHVRCVAGPRRRRSFDLATEPKAESYARMNFPVLTVTGYYDDDQPGTLHYYRNYVAHAPASAVAQLHLVIGPWITQVPGAHQGDRGSSYPRGRCRRHAEAARRLVRLCIGPGSTAAVAAHERRVLHVGCRRMAVRENAGLGILRQGIDLLSGRVFGNAAGCLPIGAARAQAARGRAAGRPGQRSSRTARAGCRPICGR